MEVGAGKCLVTRGPVLLAFARPPGHVREVICLREQTSGMAIEG